MTTRLAAAAILLTIAPLRADGLPPVEFPQRALQAFGGHPPPPAPSVPANPPPMETKAPVLAEATNAMALLDNIGLKLTPAQSAFLAENHFVLVPIESTNLATDFSTPPGEEAYGTLDEMLIAFDGISGDTSDDFSRGPGHAKLVTPDIALHAWHRYFSHLLEHVEATNLRPRLEKMVSSCMANTEFLAIGQEPEVRTRLDWLNARYSAAWVLLGSDEAPPATVRAEGDRDGGEDPEDGEDTSSYLMTTGQPSPDPRTLKERLAMAKLRLSPEAGAALDKEVSLVLGARGFAQSPLFGNYAPEKQQDYSQFRPRSHYTKSPALRGWFRAMMFLGRNGFTLANESGDGMKDALLAAAVLCSPGLAARPPLDDWQSIMEITGFFAGASDDITYPELRAWLVQAAGSSHFTPSDLLSPTLLGKLRASLDTLRPPAINSSVNVTEKSAAPTPEFRLFGQRFGWDAWVMNALLDKDGTGELPSLVSGTTVMAAFGDETAAAAARDRQREWFPDDATKFIAAFDATLPDLRRKIASIGDDDWFLSMASKQLHVIGQLAASRGDNLPHYMRSPHFGRRQLSSMMGSYTELKHDTVLYAKQNYAEMGEGGEGDRKPPPPPRGFVQPDLPFWNELSRLARFTAEGLSRHRLVPDADEEFSQIWQFVREVEFCRDLAVKEWKGIPLTPEENADLWRLSFTFMDEPIVKSAEQGSPDPTRGKTAVVTDILTDAANGRVLQIATARPLVMVALVANENHPRLVAGLAYDPHEFTHPVDKRLTDEEWRAGLYSGQRDDCPRPSWAVPVPDATEPANAE